MSNHPLSEYIDSCVGKIEVEKAVGIAKLYGNVESVLVSDYDTEYTDDNDEINYKNIIVTSFINFIVSNKNFDFTKSDIFNSIKDKRFKESLKSIFSKKVQSKDKILVFDLDKTIDKQSISDLFYTVTEKYPDNIYIITARLGHFMKIMYGKYKGDDADKNCKFVDFDVTAYEEKLMLGDMNEFFKKKGYGKKEPEKWFYYHDYMTNTIARNILSEIQKNNEKLYNKLMEVKKTNSIYSTPLDVVIAGLSKILQLYIIKKKLNCSWRNMYMFDDNSETRRIWETLSNPIGEWDGKSMKKTGLSFLKFIGGRDVSVFKDNNETHYNICFDKELFKSYQELPDSCCDWFLKDGENYVIENHLQIPKELLPPPEETQESP